MPFSLSIPSHGVLVAHAGIVPERPLEQQLLTDLINVSLPNIPSALQWLALSIVNHAHAAADSD